MSKEIEKNQGLEDEIETNCYDCQNLFHNAEGQLCCHARSINISILKEPVIHCDWYKKKDQIVTCINCKNFHETNLPEATKEGFCSVYNRVIYPSVSTCPFSVSETEKAADTLGDEIVQMVVEKLVKQDLLAPVVHARWNMSMCCVKCSHCGREALFDYKYCPHCGAKMYEDSK